MESGNRKIWVYRPAQLWLLIALLIFLVVLVGYLLFDQGARFASSELQRLETVSEQGAEEIYRLQQEKRALQQQLSMSQRSSQIDRQASIEVRNQLATLQARMLAQKEELEFYRGIVSPGEASSGLRLQKFGLEAGAVAGSYHYQLTLAQIQNNQNFVRGSVEMQLEGAKGGKQKTLSLKDVGEPGEIKFKFRYFQKFDGQIDLPEGFIPDRIVVRVKPSARSKLKAIEQTFKWPDQ